jgi:high-affinity iron transporter
MTILSFIIATLLISGIIMVPSLKMSYGQQQQGSNNNTNSFLILVNIERIRTQLSLTEKSLTEGDRNMAFAHSYIPHSVIFPSVKNQLMQVNAESSGQLESMLTDLPLTVKSGATSDTVKEAIDKIEILLDSISNQAVGSALLSNKAMVLATIGYLLQDAEQSYQLSNANQQQDKFSKVDYENAVGLVETANTNYTKIANTLDPGRRAEINSFFGELEKTASARSDYQSFSRWVTSIQRSLSASMAPESHMGQANNSTSLVHYFSTIRTLMQDVVAQIHDGNYQKADEAAITAYLDNYEYLETPIEKHDSKLKDSIELDMREGLRQMIKQRQSPQAIESFINGILSRLDKAEGLLKNDPAYNQQQSMRTSNSADGIGNNNDMVVDINQLRAGFGTYTGENKQMGQVADSTKNTVRANIDQIRIKLDDMLRLYGQGNYEGSQLAARSAYLDSYEAVEIPLRPINPDFTLDMEIKFGGLRNLIQAKSPYQMVEAKVSGIKAGLDESERLVSGTGVIAPTITFSTSFSIIFREGLESALIVGAMLTYLEASRNEKYKKHVYLGILIAITATAATWFVAQFIIEISGATRDLVEAIAGISATAVLFWVSFWILNKVETKRWIEFVKAKVWKATTTGSVMVFAMLSFFTVYREGFETVLFYQAMLSFAKYMELYVMLGLLAGIAVIVGVVFAIRKMGKKLPLRVLFALTMGVGAYMSIAFIGNALRELQDIGYLPTTHMIGIIPRLDINVATMTGIHPTLETVVAQIVLLLVYVAGSLYILILRPRRVKQIESARKSRVDFQVKDEKDGGHVEDHSF